MHFSLVYRLMILLILGSLLSACSSSGGYFSDKEKSYLSQQEAEENLEIPPDLTSSSIDDAMTIPGGTSASYSDYRSNQAGPGGATKLTGSQVLPEFDNIRIMRDGDQRWLLIKADATDVWFKAVDFWRKNGLLLVDQNPTTGVMTTDWLESRANVKQGMLTELLRSAFDSIYSSATRDQFRVRLERGEEPGTTELYLTHRGLEEKLARDVTGQADTTYWTPRPNEPETEAAMLRSLMVHLGVSEEKADSELAEATPPKQERSHLMTSNEKVELIIDERFARAWRLTGVALDRVGFVVEDRNRSEGVYYVRYKALEEEKDEGFFSFLAFWRDDKPEENQYQVKLEAMDEATRVTVNNQKGERQNSKTAVRLLTLLHEQIR